MWKGRQRQLELDFYKIHAGLAEEFEVFINGRLALVMDRIEMHEEASRDGSGDGVWTGQIEEQVTMVHFFIHNSDAS